MPEGLVKELREIEPVSLPDRDVRAGKPLILRSILRFDTLRGGNGGYWEDNGYEWYAGI